MASRTIGGQRWPEGTTVNVYLAAGWTEKTRTPAGPVIASAVVAAGLAEFTGLSEDVHYVAWATPLGITFLISSAPTLTAVRTRTDRERLLVLEASESGSSVQTYIWDTDAGEYVVAPEPVRMFVGPANPVDEGFEPRDGDDWDATA